MLSKVFQVARYAVDDSDGNGLYIGMLCNYLIKNTFNIKKATRQALLHPF